MQTDTREPDVFVEFDSEVFNDVYLPLLDNQTPIQILFGGSSSGKSFFYSQRVIYDTLAGGRNYLIVRKVANTIAKSIRNEIVKAIKSFGLESEFNIPKSDMTITCTNGYQILFAGLDDVEKLKSITPELGVVTDIGVEEATEIDRDDFKQLDKRLRGGDEDTVKRITLLFNPILKSHWIYQEFFLPVNWTDTQTEYKSNDLLILKTIFSDNRFLTTQDVNKLLNEKDEYYKQVYTLGNWGILGGVIFTNWKVADLNDPEDPYYLPVDQRTNRRNGGDFGFANDPAAVGVSHFNKRLSRIYFYNDDIYEIGLTNDILADKVLMVIGKDHIVFDSSEPKSIAELRKYGVNAVGAKKGKDSVNFGIDWLKQQEIIVDKNCVHMISELQQYHWKKDAGGNIVKIPVDKNNHLIDGGLRYAYETDMEGSSNWYMSKGDGE